MNRVIGAKDIMPRLQRACLNDLNFAKGGLDAKDLVEIAGVFGLEHNGTRTNLRYTICSALYPEVAYETGIIVPQPVELDEDSEEDDFVPVSRKPRVRKIVAGDKKADRSTAERMQHLAHNLFDQISVKIDDGLKKQGSSGYFMVFMYKVPGRGNKVENVYYAEPGANLQNEGVPYVVLLHGPLGRKRDDLVLEQRDILKVFDMLNEKYETLGIEIVDYFNLKSRRNELWVVTDRAKWLIKEKQIHKTNNETQMTRYYIKPTRARFD